MFYFRVIKELLMERLRKESPYVANAFDRDHLADDFSFRMRYVFNKIRIWYVPNRSLEGGFTRSLGEEPCPKDKWFSPTDLMAVSTPPIEDSEIGNLPTLLFGPGALSQDRYVDPEVQGGKIALIAFKQMRVQKPPNFLDRMQSTFLKQVAYNQRIMKAEEEISGINCDVADFVSKMSLDSAEEVAICVNGSQEMKKGETAMAGQLWIQGDRMMTASNPAFDGMSNSKESAVLSAAAEAVAWRNDALESPDPPRKGQRVVIYPKELTEFESVLSTGNPNINPEDGHPIAYQRVLAAAAAFEIPPVFLKEDSEAIVSDPRKAELVPQWMCMAERIATGSRPRVLEDGPDTLHSDEDSDKDVEADVEKDMYTSEMDPKLGPKTLSAQEASRQRAVASALKRSKSGFATSSSPEVSSDFGNSIVSTPQPSRQPTPLTSPTHSEDEEMSEDQRRHLKGAQKKAKAAQPLRCTSAPGTKLPPKSAHAKEPQGDGNPASRSRAEAVPSQKVPGPPKAAASLRAPADVSKPTKEQQAPKQPVKGQESPVTKVPTPRMQTRSQASRAGGLRPGGGSGQTDTCVAQDNPSKT
jgi:hypothetical protein